MTGEVQTLLESADSAKAKLSTDRESLTAADAMLAQAQAAQASANRNVDASTTALDAARDELIAAIEREYAA